MKLVNKISLWFIGIVILTTPLCMYISYMNIKKRIDNAEIVRMRAVNDNVAKQLRAGEATDKYTLGRPIKITRITAAEMPVTAFTVKEVCHDLKELDRTECKLTVNSFYKINEGYYRICSYNYVTKADEILAGMRNGILVKVLVIILSVAISARFLSGFIFRPFRKTMAAIHQFNITRHSGIRLPRTSTREFRELNEFLERMTDRAVADYRVAKEFSENASHEIQTPLAVIRSKMELLSETAIDSRQADLITDIQAAVGRLSAINRSLTLLTRLENQEFETAAPVRFCRITRTVFDAYEDRIALKRLQLKAELDKQVILQLHPNLAEILVSNLLSNAIRHNIEQGSIAVRLTKEYLSICNTGIPPEGPTSELFRRFKKSNQCADSIGLGLAIVKQICEVSGYAIRYEYCSGRHCIAVLFKAAAADTYTWNTLFPSIEDTASLPMTPA